MISRSLTQLSQLSTHGPAYTYTHLYSIASSSCRRIAYCAVALAAASTTYPSTSTPSHSPSSKSVDPVVLPLPPPSSPPSPSPSPSPSSSTAAAATASSSSDPLPSSLRQILLVRHGESTGNLGLEDSAIVGDHSLALTDRGWEQARAVGQRLGNDFFKPALAEEESNQPKRGKHKLLIYCSPYKRTRQTLQGIFEGAGVDPSRLSRVIYEDPRLREVEFGFGELPLSDQRRLRETHGWFWFRFRGGESPADCADRTSSFLESMMREAQRHGTERVLVITHGLTMRCFVTRFLHLRVEDFDKLLNPENGSIISLTLCPSGDANEMNDDVGRIINDGQNGSRWGVRGLKLGTGPQYQMMKEANFSATHAIGIARSDAYDSSSSSSGSNIQASTTQQSRHDAQQRSFPDASPLVDPHSPPSAAPHSTLKPLPAMPPVPTQPTTERLDEQRVNAIRSTLTSASQGETRSAMMPSSSSSSHSPSLLSAALRTLGIQPKPTINEQMQQAQALRTILSIADSNAYTQPPNKPSNETKGEHESGSERKSE